MTERLVSIYLGEFANASLVKAALEEEGVPALMHQPNMSFLFPWIVHPGRGLTAVGQVVVPASEVERSADILGELDAIEGEACAPDELPSTGLAVPLMVAMVVVALAAWAVVWAFTDVGG